MVSDIRQAIRRIGAVFLQFQLHHSCPADRKNARRSLKINLTEQKLVKRKNLWLSRPLEANYIRFQNSKLICAFDEGDKSAEDCPVRR
jgi:hypothetical protein